MTSPQPTAASADVPPACPEQIEGAVPPPLPPWVDAYLSSLRTSFHKPEAARAAGIDLPTVAELRDTHPAFAAQERRIMTAYADLLESEALRRVTVLPTPGPDGKFLRPFGSDRLLLRLLECYHPGFAPAGAGSGHR